MCGLWTPSTGLGLHQPRHPDLYRVLRHPQEPRVPHLQSQVTQLGLLESDEHQNSGEHREQQSQPVLGEKYPDGGETARQVFQRNQSQLHQVKILPEVILHFRLR